MLDPHVEAQGVDAIAADDVWAVGFLRQREGQVSANTPVAEHYDGTTWTRVPTPVPGPGSNVLSSVSAVGPDDVWAVGGGTTPLALHWDGHGWARVPTQQPVGTSPKFTGVAAISPRDVWAVGYTNVGFSGARGFVEHWDGTDWSLVKTPYVAATSQFWGVTATATGDVWLVGSKENKASVVSTLTEHWDGSSWSFVRSPSPVEPQDSSLGLASVSEASPTDVWAVGSYSTDTSHLLIEHFDGAKWSRVKAPEPNGADALHGVNVVAGDDVWAVGTTKPWNSDEQTLIERWNGTAWSVVSSPSRHGKNHLLSVASTSAGDAWAVGTGPGKSSVVLHWNGTRWSP